MIYGALIVMAPLFVAIKLRNLNSSGNVAILYFWVRGHAILYITRLFANSISRRIHPWHLGTSFGASLTNKPYRIFINSCFYTKY